MKNFTDLTGKQFGKLIVLKLEHIKNYNRFWNCSCACGNTTIAREDHLVKGTTRSCGCFIKERNIERCFKDITGERFGRLVAISKEDKKGNQWRWLCQCDCGNECIVMGSSLRAGTSQSCGCLVKERMHELNLQHGEADSDLGHVKASMVQRCTKPNSIKYKDYGGRGIKICKEWLVDNTAFYTWAKVSGYKKGLTLERIDNDGDYCPENCKWATWEEQANNKRSSTLITFEGKTKTLSQWSKETGISSATLSQRKKRGWDERKILTTPTGKYERKKKK